MSGDPLARLSERRKFFTETIQDFPRPHAKAFALRKVLDEGLTISPSVSLFPVLTFRKGELAQLVERVVRNDEVRGSIPLLSTSSESGG